MKVTQMISDIKAKMKALKKSRLTGKESFISGITKSRSFHQLTPQERIILVAQLIAVFQTDYGFTPDGLIRSLANLNHQLNHDLLGSFTSQYSH